MKAFPSSLRAKRGNPDVGADAGLPRRFGEAEVYPERLQGSRRAPRNDGILCAFAPWREPNLVPFSRKAAKALRGQGSYGSGSKSQECAADVLRLLRHNMPPEGLAEAVK